MNRFVFDKVVSIIYMDLLQIKLITRATIKMWEITILWLPFFPHKCLPLSNNSGETSQRAMNLWIVKSANCKIATFLI